MLAKAIFLALLCAVLVSSEEPKSYLTRFVDLLESSIGNLIDGARSAIRGNVVIKTGNNKNKGNVLVRIDDDEEEGEAVQGLPKNVIVKVVTSSPQENGVKIKINGVDWSNGGPVKGSKPNEEKQPTESWSQPPVVTRPPHQPTESSSQPPVVTRPPQKPTTDSWTERPDLVNITSPDTATTNSDEDNRPTQWTNEWQGAQDC